MFKNIFEHVTKLNDDKDDDICIIIRTTNVWENENIKGDVLIQALYHHPTFTFPILMIIFALRQHEKMRENAGLF